jgi:SagB-type dehydrogenase family enzyme
MIKHLLLLLLLLPLLLAYAPVVLAQNPLAVKFGTRVDLPKPQLAGGLPLNDALAHRRSIRSFGNAPLTLTEISQLAWSAQGVTDDKGHRTAPSAHAMYFLHLYVATPEGVFEYLPATHQLQCLLDKDVRSQLSSQAVIHAASIVFIITGEYARAASSIGSEINHRVVDLEAGHAAQNVLLQATSLQLGAVPVGGIEPNLIKKAVPLPQSTEPIYLIPVGHPQ